MFTAAQAAAHGGSAKKQRNRTEREAPMAAMGGKASAANF